MDKPKYRFRRWAIVNCDCHPWEPQQILRRRISEQGGPEYKIAYYNAIFGGRHWVPEHKIMPFRGF